ncbi:hypothetical protein JHK82_027896 [Glycine max]|nr:hypothetical protein JHK85_028562 [Glycine max]KAG5003887.1 hypothetical protein JHK86_028026 [Glycine max]KAG5127061.1 hypothetical protein JHK82_027896 [Glycine max]KAG5151674.1 hypothetical protein JHK84_028146 [Glycine max]
MQISTKPAHLPRSCVYDFSLLTLSLFFLEAELFKSLLFCLPLFLLVGPFAPPSITGTDVRVDRGEVVQSFYEHNDIKGAINALRKLPDQYVHIFR